MIYYSIIAMREADEVDNELDTLDYIVFCEDLRLLRLRLSISSRSSDFLILNLYSILIEVRRVKLYLIELFRIAISCGSIVDYWL